ncbi:ubiquitin carboxyl-terminal hydrolase 8-like [Macrobrachium nipponense]|uniref:ubiquitin carboxyl-terminal hydrolase 8-like n=1 Tax=Macrobrachium nipponense TaxID=159736 RepID=UPI0030C8096F
MGKRMKSLDYSISNFSARYECQPAEGTNQENAACIETGNFYGFEELETGKARRLNKHRCFILRQEEETNLFEGFKEAEVIKARKTNLKKVTHLRGLQKHETNKHTPHYVAKKIPGLLNLGNTCYMNSVMQCLNCVEPLVKYFTEGTYHSDIYSMSKYGGTLAREVGAALEAMNNGIYSPIALQDLKSVIGNLHFPFRGSRQHDSHEFLLFLLSWLHEDLRGGTMPFLQDTQDCMLEDVENNESSVICSLFQGENRHRIICNTCQYEPLSYEPFTIMSLSLPFSGGCTLADLLQNTYMDSCIDYKCPRCKTQGKGTRKSDIRKLPPVLVLHLNRFDYNISARKKQNYVDFPLENLSLVEHATSTKRGSTQYNLCGVSNHYGSLNAGHYTSFCKSYDSKFWYRCDDQNVTKLRTSVKTSAAYLLFYESVHINNMNLQ